ncbi:14469_t:CDS:2 [Racocetra persica]|uniref:14469_t:CDS:1 n=1 Tax=Racocetra persica TaxID=160502 RepID=A0ACA9MWG9_9GLOM|nr:14469_t:CDS:2 [Racocetra persica]
MPPRRQHLGGGRLRKTTGNKFKCPGCPHTFDSHTEVNNHVKKIHKTTLLGLTYQQDSKQAKNLLFKVDSHKEDSCKKIDRLINELSYAEKMYLPLTEHGYPVKKIFDQSRQSILKLQESFRTFTQRQLSLIQTILNEKVLAEKKKVTATIENLRIEVANLKYELIKNNNQIMLLNKSDYYIERCYLLEQENSVLVKQNLELFEEIRELRKEIEILYEEINKLKKRNESLSCVIVIDD